MIVIRAAQMKVLEGAAYRRFEDHMVTHLRSIHGVAISPMSDEDVRDLIRDGAARARAYELAEAYDLCRFIECMVTFGEDFDTQSSTAWAGEILQMSGLSGTSRMDLIDDYDHLLVHGNPPAH